MRVGIWVRVGAGVFDARGVAVTVLVGPGVGERVMVGVRVSVAVGVNSGVGVSVSVGVIVSVDVAVGGNSVPVGTGEAVNGMGA